MVDGRFVSEPSFENPLVGPFSSAVVSTAEAFPTAGATFAFLSTGRADRIENAEAASLSHRFSDDEAPSRPSVFDLSTLRVDFVAPSSANCVTFDFSFYSEEWPEYVGSEYNDVFIATLDSNDWSYVAGSIRAPANMAFDDRDQAITVNTSFFTDFASGLAFNGRTRRLVAAAPIAPGRHSVYFTLFDAGDSAVDSGVAIDNLRVRTVKPGGCRRGADLADVTDAPSSMRDLAKSYRPRLLFAPEEKWRPIGIRSFFAERSGGKPFHQLCWGSYVKVTNPGNAGNPVEVIKKEDCEGIADPSQLTPRALSKNAKKFNIRWIDVGGPAQTFKTAASPDPACRVGGLSDCDTGPTSTAYYRATKHGGWTALDYWYFYRTNDAKKLGVSSEHEGDWEGMTVWLTAQKRVVWASYTGHGHSSRVTRDFMRKMNPSPLADDERVSAYISVGGHAAYPYPCGGKLFSGCGKYIGNFDQDTDHPGGRPWGMNESDCAQQRCVIAFGAKNDDYPFALNTHWAFFPGYWGPDRAGPHSPAIGPDGWPGGSLDTEPPKPFLGDNAGRFWNPWVTQAVCTRAGSDCKKASEDAGPVRALTEAPLDPSDDPPATEAAVAPGAAANCADFQAPYLPYVSCSESVLDASVGTEAAADAGPSGYEPVKGGPSVSGSGPGIVQALGDPFVVGDQFRAVGAPPAADAVTTLAIRGAAGMSIMDYPAPAITPGVVATIDKDLALRVGSARVLPLRGQRAGRTVIKSALRKGSTVTVIFKSSTAPLKLAVTDKKGVVIGARTGVNPKKKGWTTVRVKVRSGLPHAVVVQSIPAGVAKTIKKRLR